MMKIKDVKYAFKIADVELIENSTTLNFIYLDPVKDENKKILPKNILTKNYSRVYLIVIDKKIMKIGASQDKGGMKGTLSIYKDGGVKGRPSIRSFGVWYLLYSYAIKRKHKIEFYMIYHEDFETEVKGLTNMHKVSNASINCKIIEECCIKDFKNKNNNKYPEWNLQEQGFDWPDEIKFQHSQITTESLTRKTTRGKLKNN